MATIAFLEIKKVVINTYQYTRKQLRSCVDYINKKEKHETLMTNLDKLLCTTNYRLNRKKIHWRRKVK